MLSNGPAGPRAAAGRQAAPPRACIGIGANLGDAVAQVRAAFDRIAELPRTRLLARSAVYRSAPVDAQGPDFFNAVALVETRLSAPELLAALHRIEHGAGRTREYRNAPRTLDLDLLLYGDGTIDAPPGLIVPHPRMSERAFVLRPLLDVAPDATIPGIGAAIACLSALHGQRIEAVPESRPESRR